jgi:hypothetical protein
MRRAFHVPAHVPLGRFSHSSVFGCWDFHDGLSIPIDQATLDLCSELLRNAEVSSILRRGNSHQTMLITVNIQKFHPRAAVAAALGPCRRSVEVTRRQDNALALAGRCAS